jgi:hypothetical protein
MWSLGTPCGKVSPEKYDYHLEKNDERDIDSLL